MKENKEGKLTIPRCSVKYCREEVNDTYWVETSKGFLVCVDLCKKHGTLAAIKPVRSRT